MKSVKAKIALDKAEQGGKILFKTITIERKRLNSTLQKQKKVGLLFLVLGIEPRALVC
jgi:ribosomal protein S12